VGEILRAVVIGAVIVLVGSMARNLLWMANLHVFTAVPWAVAVMAVFLFFFWRYLNGAGPPPETSQYRRTSLRANRLPLNVWVASLIAGGLGLVALVLALRVANRMVLLPEQPLPDLPAIPAATVISLLMAGAPVAGIVEEAAFRGYMQGPLEKRCGLVVAILITGTMFALLHLDFTPILWPYYVAVAAIYGIVTYLTNSILPAIVLHTAGNIYSSLDLWMRGRAEWQAAKEPAELIWQAGPDQSFWIASAALAIATALTIGGYLYLARVSRRAVRERVLLDAAQ
jgi:membrane protease YdiL (CAAX protease family)